jgi:hypothetical protein
MLTKKSTKISFILVVLFASAVNVFSTYAQCNGPCERKVEDCERGGTKCSGSGSQCGVEQGCKGGIR